MELKGENRPGNPVQLLFIGLIRFYRRAVSPLFPPRCRFYPSCSEYAEQALRRHGVVRGGWMSIVRLLKCHPLHPGGYDPVP